MARELPKQIRPEGDRHLEIGPKAGISPGVVVFLIAIIAAVAAIIFGIKATNEEVLASAQREVSPPAPPPSIFVPGEAVETMREEDPDKPASPAKSDPSTPPDVRPVAVEPAVPKPVPPPVEVPVATRDFRGEATALRADLEKILEVADSENASGLATSEFVRGSALKSAGDQAFSGGRFEQAVTLYERGRESLSKAAFEAVLASFESGIDEGGLSGLRETPTARWIEAEGQIELARANLDAGLVLEGVRMVQVLKESIPDLREDTLASWLSAGSEAVEAERREVAIRMYRKVLQLDPGNTEASDYLFTNAYLPGTIIENTLAMKFAYVPPGTFMMGSPESEAFRDNDETQREVTLTRGFFMGIHEVTQEQWKEVMNEPLTVRIDDEKFFGPKLPAHSVSWEDAKEFCRRLSDREGRDYRLPTEAEWEYAARAGTTTPYNTGSINLTTKDANVYDPSGTGPGAPLPVGGAGPANGFGLFDMHGNVWEWIEDWSGPYDPEDVIDPKGFPEDQLPSLDLAMRVVRSGSFIDDAAMARSANRWEYSAAAGNEFIGFRIVLEVDSF